MTEEIQNETSGTVGAEPIARIIEMKVTAVAPDTDNGYKKGHRVTLCRNDGKICKVNIPDDLWGDGYTYGLNLVFGEGCHYQ